MDGLLYQNALRRVARVLDQHAEIIFGDEAVVTRAYLPALVGTSREMTGRVLRQLEADGVVERIGRQRLRLLDAWGLARTAAAAARPATALGTSSSPRRGARCKSDVPRPRAAPADRQWRILDCQRRTDSSLEKLPSSRRTPPSSSSRTIPTC